MISSFVYIIEKPFTQDSRQPVRVLEEEKVLAWPSWPERSAVVQQ